ncbi:MAG: DUF1289 domain-containing protein [Pseudomonadota bacterium]
MQVDAQLVSMHLSRDRDHPLPTDTSSPCIRLCTIDPLFRMCAGCGRTLDEIARWSQLAETERKRVMQTLPNRLTKMAKNSNFGSVEKELS